MNSQERIKKLDKQIDSTFNEMIRLGALRAWKEERWNRYNDNGVIKNKKAHAIIQMRKRREKKLAYRIKKLTAVKEAIELCGHMTDTVKEIEAGEIDK